MHRTGSVNSEGFSKSLVVAVLKGGSPRNVEDRSFKTA
jgi:hypothetical protein